MDFLIDENVVITYKHLCTHILTSCSTAESCQTVNKIIHISCRPFPPTPITSSIATSKLQ